MNRKDVISIVDNETTELKGFWAQTIDVIRIYGELSE